MAPLLKHPTSVTHQGSSILFAVDDASPRNVYFNVLDPSRGNIDDALDWSGYSLLTFPAQVATVGLSVGRLSETLLPSTIIADGLIQAVSDQQFVYLFQGAGSSIFVSRYLAVQSVDANPDSVSNLNLQPTWEVRYRRSGKADIAATDKDTFSPLSLDGVPFLEPIYELPLGFAGIDFSTASFWVSLQPTSSGDYRWQIFVPNPSNGTIQTYAFARTDDGWFALDPAQIDPVTATLAPDAVISLVHGTTSPTPLPVCGPVSGANYFRQESVVTNSNAVIKLQRAARLLLMVPVTYGGATAVATLDFGASADGLLAQLDTPGASTPLSFSAGLVQPAGSMLSFNGSAALNILSGAKAGPLVLGQDFTIEFWTYPTGQTLGQQSIVCGDPTPVGGGGAPAVWIINGLRVGASDGAGSSVLTDANVLSLNAWNHIAVVNSASGCSIYINATEVTVTQAEAVDPPPPAQPLTSIGGQAVWSAAGAFSSIANPFVGALDEVRVWSVARTGAQILEALYVELASPATTTGLMGYWRLDDGEGKTAKDLSPNGRNCALAGPRWRNATSPVSAPEAATTVFAPNGLTLVVGLLATSAAYPNFGNLKSGARVAVLQGADGYIHIYYPGSDGTFLGAQFDATIDRAFYGIPWISGAGTPAAQSGALVIIARQSGPLLNSASITIDPDDNGFFCTATLDDGAGSVETWTGLPRRVDLLEAIMNGDATASPLDARLKSGSVAFFDPSGSIPMVVIPDANPQSGDMVYFLGTRPQGAFSFASVTIGPPANGLADVTFTFSSDSAHPDEVLTRVLPGTPVNVAAFEQTLAGANPAYPYSAPSPSGSTQVYAVLTDGRPIYIFAPARVDAASIVVAPASGGAPSNCDATLTLGAATASWTDIPRAGQAFVSAILAGSTPAQKAVIALIRIFPAAAVNVVNGTTTTEAPLSAFLSLVTFVNDGVTAPLSAFSAVAQPLQSATLIRGGQTSEILGASTSFSIAMSGTLDNGCVALVDFGAAGSATAALLRAGTAGGWLEEPPRTAVHFPEKTIAMILAPTLPVELVPGADLTVEAWSQIESSDPTAGAYPRMVHVVQADASGIPSAYALGLYSAQCLNLLGNSTHTASFTASDGGASSSQWLFPNTEYSVQCYVSPDLSTGAAPAALFIRTSGSSVETVAIANDGSLTYTLADGGTQTSQTSAKGLLDDLTWQVVTLTRTDAVLTLYLDGVECLNIPNPTALPTSQSTFQLTTQAAANPLQMQLSTVAVYSRALSVSEISDRLFRSVEPDDFGLQLLWTLGEAQSPTIQTLFATNTAITTSGLYTVAMAGPAGYLYFALPGPFFGAFFANGDSAVATTRASISTSDWQHYAGSVMSKRGVTFDGTMYADCGSDASSNPGSGFSAEAWIWPTMPDGAQRSVILARSGYANADRAFEFGLDPNGYPYLMTRLSGSGDENSLRKTFLSPNPLPTQGAHYLVATMSIVSVHDDASGGNVSSLVGQVYVDGVPTIPGPETAAPPSPSTTLYKLTVLGGSGSGYYPAGGNPIPIQANDLVSFALWQGQTGTPTAGVSDPANATATVTMPSSDVTITAIGSSSAISITQSTVQMTMGCALTAPGNDCEAYFTGGIASLRLWSAALSADAVATAYGLRRAPANTNGLVSSWSFMEQAGTIAYDSAGANTATLSTSHAWTVFTTAPELDLLVNGAAVPLQSVPIGQLGDWGTAPQVSVGASQAGPASFTNPFIGSIDEVRVWGTRRTQSQVVENMNRHLVGNESGLSGYWRFDLGSGQIVPDATAWGNDLALVAAPSSPLPQWVTSAAPISNEAPLVQNAVNGFLMPQTAIIDEGPTVFEYPDSEVDAYGNSFSVMKRAYAYVANQRVSSTVGYKVGDLQRIYLGQIQTKPQLIGFIEGAPPLPSENLTRPYYADPIAMYFTYDGIASVNLDESIETSYSISTTSASNVALSFDGKVGPTFKGDESAAIPPVTPVVISETVKWKVSAQAAGKTDWKTETTSGQGTGVSQVQKKSLQLESGGAWEDPDAPLLPSKERRYIPSNEGMALVKSGTADLYGLYLSSTGALVGTAVVPDPSIKVDVNLIPFPLDSTYVNNGSLDGYVGFVPDPAAGGNPSFMRPAEAYALENEIEAGAARAAAWYSQYNASSNAQAKNTDLTSVIANNPYYDWAANLPTQSLVNKYVWSASGGLYTESQGYGAKKQESYGGSYDLSWSAGLAFGFEYNWATVGLAVELNILSGTGWTYTADQDEDQSSDVGLEVDVRPESFLGQSLSLTQPPFFSETPTPGKVDGYRFATYYLAPSVQNTTAFLTAVDPVWYSTSMDPNAVAIRQMVADSAGSKSWRVLHRVTYVSRVPPTYQSTPLANQAPPIAEPRNLPNNALLIALANDLLLSTPTPREIGAAVVTILTEKLVSFIPWWGDFLRGAAEQNSASAAALAQIKTDAVTYLTEHYAASGQASLVRHVTRRRRFSRPLWAGQS